MNALVEAAKDAAARYGAARAHEASVDCVRPDWTQAASIAAAAHRAQTWDELMAAIDAVSLPTSVAPGRPAAST